MSVPRRTLGRNLKAYLVELELSYDDFGSGDGDGDGLAVALLTDNCGSISDVRRQGFVRGLQTSVDVKSVLETVNGGDLALASLVCSAHDLDLILDAFSIRRVFVVRGFRRQAYVFADWDAVLQISKVGRYTCKFRKPYLRTLCFSRSSLLSGACGG